VNAAVQQGPAAIAKLPPAWQPGAWAKYAGASGLGRYVDEIAQHGTQYRGLGQQLAGAASFATDRDQIAKYAQVIAKDNPLLAALMNAPPAVYAHRRPIALGAIAGGNAARAIRGERSHE
jgi:hypothetical protein